MRTTIFLCALIAATVAAAFAAVGSRPEPSRAQDAATASPASFTFKDFVRVIDGDTVEIFYGTRRHGIGFTGIDVDQGNTPCGQAATGRLWELTSGGAVRFEGDGAKQRDERDREMYSPYAADGTSIELALVRDGLARASKRQSPLKNDLQEAERQARKDGRGCLWGGTAAAPPDAAAPTFAQETPPIARAAALPSGFEDILIAGGFTEATTFAVAPDGRLFVAEKHGIVRVVKNGAVLATPAIDISAQVNDYWDHGLLGLALDPNFGANGYMYLLYTYEHNANAYDDTKTSRVSRVTVSGDVANPATLVTILGSANADSCNSLPLNSDCIPSDSPSHGIGTAVFGLDGKLYVTSGDGASFNSVNSNGLRSQSLDSLAGKVIRVNPDGSAPNDNPFWDGNASHVRSKVWAYGLRNPFRQGVNPSTGRIILGDVGWEATEELNAIRKGGNYGWPCYEGTPEQPGYSGQAVCQALYQAGGVTAPIYEYSDPGSKAVVGGVFASGYTGGTQNAYFFGDYGMGWIKYVHLDANDDLVGPPVTLTDEAQGPVALQLAPNGQVYYLAINSGELRYLHQTGGNRQPTAVVSANPSNGLQPLDVTFSSAGSSDPDGDPLTFAWNFGDGTPGATGPTALHRYNNAGTFTATLTASDGKGGTGAAQVTITVGSSAPTMTITSPAANTKYKVGDVIQLAGTGFDGEDGNLPGSALSWEVILHHGTHIHYFLTATGPSASFTVPDHGEDNYFEINLRGRDSSNLVGQATVNITPQMVNLTLQTDSPGMNITLNGVSHATPYTVPLVLGSAHTVYAPAQTNGTFAGWSDGGAQQHDIVMSAAKTLTAAYSSVVTFDTAPPEVNQPLVGQYPIGQINWGTTTWYLSGPWSAFTTNSVGFRDSSTTSGTFSFTTARRMTSVDAHNGGFTPSTVTLACGTNPVKSQTLQPDAVATIVTGWTTACTTVTVGSSNGWDTNFDNITHVPASFGADSDGDGVPDIGDNCPGVANANQANADADFIDLDPWNKPYDDITWPNSDTMGNACDPDADNDGLAEGANPPCAGASAATNPLVRDSDGDRYLDGAECALGTNPANAGSKPSAPSPAEDPDRDGLSSATETAIGSNPNAADTDGDGVLDSTEYFFFNSSPLIADTDSDGCPDGREIASINGDRRVTAIDLMQIAIAFGTSTPPFDTNGDGTISSLDLAFVAREFGSCP